jgi:uncharacterized protein HemX
MENEEYQKTQNEVQNEGTVENSTSEETNEKTIKKDEGVGPIIGSIIVIILIVIGGIYYWNSIVSKEVQQKTAENTPEESIDSIEADLNAEISDLDIIEADIQAGFDAQSNI